MRGLCVLAVALLCHGALDAAPTLPRLFGDSMVLQRDRAVPVWGTAEPGEAVKVKFAGQTKQAIAGKDGAWRVNLDPMAFSSQPRTLEVASPRLAQPILLGNVLVGDVWICAGQSNMELALGSASSPEDTRAANFPGIRCVKVAWASAAEPADDIVTYGWHAASPATVPGFTAAGYFFAREINQRTGIPIGLIDDNMGGTAIEPWCARAGLANTPELAAISTNYEARMAEYRRSVPAQLIGLEKWIHDTRQALAENRDLPRAQWPVNPLAAKGMPCALFNGMIAPLVPYGIKGVLWYQGENNFNDGNVYFHKMKALISGWRDAWGQDAFPFYFAQLANLGPLQPVACGGGGFAGVRLAQLKALSITNTGMAVTIDIGEANNIHPRNKQDVGKRLALWALAKDYGKRDLVYSGPLYRDMKIEGNAIRLFFDCTGSGLMAGRKNGTEPTAEDKDGKLKQFAIAGENGKWVWANAVIDKDTVLVSRAEMPKPVAACYAIAGNPEGANLYNKEGLPASPFRTNE